MVPKGWERKALDEISDVIDCKHRTPKYVKNGIPLVSPGTIKWGAIDLESPTKRVTAEEYESLMDHCTVEYGDLVLSRNQSVGIASFVDSDKPFVLGQDTVLVKPKGSDPRFLFYNLQSTDTQKTIFKLAGGSTFSRINLGDIRKLKAIYPPFAEQQKIAKILSTWDKAISTTERLIENSTQQKKALMQQLLTGKKRLLDESGKRFEGEWKVVKLQSVLDLMRSGLSRKLENDNVGIAVIRSNNMGSKYTNNVDLKYWYLDDPQGANVSNYILDDGDLLVNFINSASQIGKSCIYRKNLEIDSIYTTNILRIKPNLDKICSTFLYLITQTANYDSYITSITKPAVNQASFTTKEFGNLEFNLPSLEEQQKIATVLTNADKEIELLEQQLADLQQEKKALMQQLLTGKKRVKLND